MEYIKLEMLRNMKTKNKQLMNISLRQQDKKNKVGGLQQAGNYCPITFIQCFIFSHIGSHTHVI